MATVKEKMTAIVDAMRDKTGDTDLLGLDDMARGVNDVYNSGKQAQYDEFWDGVQKYGKRSNYGYGFYHWNMKYIRPKYKIVTTDRPTCLFAYNTALKKVEKEYFDLSGFQPSNGVGASSTYSCFYGCTSLEEIEDVGINAGGYYQTYNRCSALRRIEKMRCREEGEYSAPFTQCDSLEDLTIEGVIGKSFPISYSPLSVESMKSVITHLKDYAGTDKEYTYTVTFKTSAFKALEDEGVTSPNNNTWAEYIDDLKWNLTLA